MALPKTNEKRRKQKRDAERRRREKIKNNKINYEKAKQLERERYHKRKEEDKIKTINELSSRDKNAFRRRWKSAAAKYRKKKKQNNDLLKFMNQNSSPSTPTSFEAINDNEVECVTASTPSISRKEYGRKRVARNRSRTYRELLKVKEKFRITEQSKEIQNKAKEKDI